MEENKIPIKDWSRNKMQNHLIFLYLAKDMCENMIKYSKDEKVVKSYQNDLEIYIRCIEYLNMEFDKLPKIKLTAQEKISIEQHEDLILSQAEAIKRKRAKK